MGLQSMTLFCHRCLRETGHTKGTTSHGLHLLLSLFTAGLWLVPWFIIAIVNSSAPKCARCGSSYDQRLAVRSAARLDDERRSTTGRLGDM